MVVLALVTEAGKVVKGKSRGVRGSGAKKGKMGPPA